MKSNRNNIISTAATANQYQPYGKFAEDTTKSSTVVSHGIPTKGRAAANDGFQTAGLLQGR